MLVRWRVPLGYALGVAAVVLARPSPKLLTAGVAVAFLGEMLRVWAAGHLVKGGSSLTRSGPYAHTRNPLYLGSFLVGLGFTLAASRVVLLVGFVILFLCVYLPVMRIEARRMREVHPREYETFEREVPLFLPRMSPRPGLDSRAWSLERALANREHWTVLGSVAAALFLCWRMG